VKRTARSDIPRKTVYRLSVYLRCLNRLRANLLQTVSSEALAHAAGVKSTQLRKDLTYLGPIGTRGRGYDVEQLSELITATLGTNSLQPVILVGVGNLGSALLSYRGFAEEGFQIVGAFDLQPGTAQRRRLRVGVQPMEHLAEVVRLQNVRMAILTVPAAAAQEVANQLVAAGIMGILNFSPIVLSVPEDVMVNNVNLAIELENLSYFLQQ
jgi:redox-sensing transcriptional repressor